MANDNELKIILSLVDEASGKLKESLKGVEKGAEDTTKKVNSGFQEANANLREFRRSCLVAGIAVGGIVAVTQEWSKHNLQTKEAFDSIGKSIRTLTSFLGSIFAPTIVAVADMLKVAVNNMQGFFSYVTEAWTKLFNSISYGTQYVVGFLSALKSGVGILEAHKIASSVAAEAVEDMGAKFKASMVENLPNADDARNKLKEVGDVISVNRDLFLSGQISAEDYYQTITSGGASALMTNQLALQQMNELATLTTQVRSQEIMEAQRSTSEQIMLLNFYKENYMQAHSGMKAAAVEMGQALKTNLSGALSNIILDVKSGSAAFKEFGQAMLKAIVDYITQKAVAWALEKTLLAGTVAASAAAGASVAAAWAPAAAMVSLATLGSNAVPASAAIINVNILSAGFAIPKMMAYGGDQVVSRPTLFMAGENGPERAIFQPLGGGGSRGGGDINIQINSPVVTNTDAINELAETISARLARETERI